MKSFNPIKAAHYEVSWWQAHHRGDKLALAYFLYKNQQEILQLRWYQAMKAVYFLVQAARGHDKRDWRLAIECMTKFYDYINSIIKHNYSAQKIAEIEVESWRVHDKLEDEINKTKLIELIAKLWSGILEVPVQQMLPAARSRVEAFTDHDNAETQGLSETEANIHWQNAEKHLQDFYEKVAKVVANLH